jgi:predicted MFS family arabinose efflux permease
MASRSPISSIDVRQDGQHPRAHTALGLLMLVALFSYIDRIIISILQEGIRADLGLSDTQLGTLTGLAFAIFYTLFAVPIARLADLWVRKFVIIAALAMWSLMTAASGLAGGFLALLLCRIGVAIGEAGSVPTTHSMISDYFPRRKRATALSIWGLTLSVGPMAGFLLGGWLHDAVGWRATFVIIGLVGAAFVPVILLALPEPVRGATDDRSDDPRSAATAPPIATAARLLWNLRSFRFLCLGTALHAFSYLAMVTWNAPFYQRTHDLSATETGIYLGLILGIGGGLGTLLGGIVADRLGRRDVRWYMVIPALAALLIIPAGLVQYLAADVRVSLAAAFLVMLLGHAYLGPVNGTSQSLVGAGIRAVTSATLVLVTNIVGMGLGPVVTGVISDTLAASFGLGDGALRYAVLCTLVANLGSALLYGRAAVLLPADLPGHGRSGPATTTPAPVAPVSDAT